MAKGDVVLVPRIGGGLSFGRITTIESNHVRVDLLQDKTAIAVITRKSDLKPMPSHIRVSA